MSDEASIIAISITNNNNFAEFRNMALHKAYGKNQFKQDNKDVAYTTVQMFVKAEICIDFSYTQLNGEL